MKNKLTNREIGMRLKTSRGAKGYTLQQVADKVGVDRSTIQRYEVGGIVVIKMPVLESICKCLEVNPKWVLGESESKHRLTLENFSDDIMSLAQRLNSVPEQVRASLIEVLNRKIDEFEE